MEEEINVEKGRNRVLLINAISTREYNEQRLAYLRRFAFEETDLHLVSIDQGFPNLEYEAEHVVNTVEVMKKAVWAEENGFHAIVINCFNDPGLDAARENVNIPVIGAAEAALITASRLGHRFGVLSLSRKMIPRIERHLERYGLTGMCAGVASLDIGVPRLQAEGLSEEIQALMMLKINGMLDKGEEALTIGCTAALGINDALGKICPVPLVDPSIVSLKAAEAMAHLYRLCGLSHSKYRLYAKCGY